MYNISSEDLPGIIRELNKHLAHIKKRLDSLQGISGDIEIGGRLVTGSDVVVSHPLRGIVLKDDGAPSSYWKMMVKNDGTWLSYQLGGGYVDELASPVRDVP